MKASVYIATSLDGFIAREDGSVDWLPGPGSDDYEMNKNDDAVNGNESGFIGFETFYNSIDVVVMGRKTFEDVLNYSNGAELHSGKRVVVVSSTLSKDSDKLPNNVEIKSGLISDIAKDLEESGAKHLYIDGGKTIQGFLNAGLIQELIITQIPFLIGQGIPLFGPLNEDLQLQLIEAHTTTNGWVQSRYKVQG